MIRRYMDVNGRVRLWAENEQSSIVDVTGEEDFQVIGVATSVIHSV